MRAACQFIITATHQGYTLRVDMAKVEGIMLELLLRDGAKRLGHQCQLGTLLPPMEAYFACMDALDTNKDAVLYNEDGSVTLDLTK